MQLSLSALLSDPNIHTIQNSSQRLLSVSIAAVPDSESRRSLLLNFGLIIDCSKSMKGERLEIVKQEAVRLICQLNPDDRLSVVTFDHVAKVIVSNRVVGNNINPIVMEILLLQSGRGSSIDNGLMQGIKEILSGVGTEYISQAILLIGSDNEHGDNDRCIKLAGFSTENNITLHPLVFGEHWNQNVLEKIADVGSGTLAYIEQPENARAEFGRIFSRIQSVGLNNAYLQIMLQPRVRLAELKPIAQVAPDTIELPVLIEGDRYLVRLGNLMTNIPRVVLLNIYAGQFPHGLHPLLNLQIAYDDPSSGKTGMQSNSVTVSSEAVSDWQSMPNATVQQHFLALKKYRLIQLAEQKLQQGDYAGAAVLLQDAAKTAIQMNDIAGGTILQGRATQLASKNELSESDQRKIRIVAKTILQ